MNCRKRTSDNLFMIIMVISIVIIYSFADAQESEDLQERVKTLEERIESLEGITGQEGPAGDNFNPFEEITDRVNVSGYIDLEYSDFETENSSLRPLINPHSTFSNSHINLYLDSNIGDYFRAFSEIRFVHHPHSMFVEENLKDIRAGQVIIERAWLDVNVINEFNIKFGKFLTPYGIWNVEHGSPILVSTRTPLLLRKQLFPEAVTGVQIYGALYPAEWEFEYHAWVGNGKGMMPAMQDMNNDKAIGGRVAVSAPVRNLWKQFKLLKIGVSGYTGQVEMAEFMLTPPSVADINGTPMNMADDLLLEENDLELIVDLDRLFGGMGLMYMNGQWMSMTLMNIFMNNGYTPRGEPIEGYVDSVIGYDLQFTIYKFLFQGEYVSNNVNPDQDGVESFIESAFYIQGAIRQDLKKYGVIAPFARYGESDPNDELDGEIGELTIETYGINYKPVSRVVFKAEYHFHNFHKNSDRNFEMFTSSVTVAF